MKMLSSFFYMMYFLNLIYNDNHVQSFTFRKCYHKNKFRSSTVPLKSLIVNTDMWSIYAIVSISAATGLELEKNTKVGKSLSGPVCAMLITSFLTNIGILPSTGSIHITNLQSFVVKLATPLLLLGANLFKIVKETKGLLNSFLLGTLGTLIGSLLGYFLFMGQINTIGLLDDGWKVVSALTSKNIGGGLNYMAVVDILKVSPSVISTGLAVDNVLGLIYFPIISYLGQRYNNNNNNNSNNNNTDSLSISNNNNNNNNNNNSSNNKEINDLCTALAVGLSITAVAETITKISNIPSLIVSTLLSVLFATVFSNKLKTIITPAELLGKLLLLLFFGSIGNSSGNIVSTLASTSSLSLIGYGVVLYVVHFATIYTFGKILKISEPDILLGSNANIGNAATASALASTMGWQSRLVPAILVGNLGNFIGTFIGLWLGINILKPMVNSL